MINIVLIVLNIIALYCLVLSFKETLNNYKNQKNEN